MPFLLLVVHAKRSVNKLQPSVLHGSPVLASNSSFQSPYVRPHQEPCAVSQRSSLHLLPYRSLPLAQTRAYTYQMLLFSSVLKTSCSLLVVSAYLRNTKKKKKPFNDHGRHLSPQALHTQNLPLSFSLQPPSPNAKSKAKTIATEHTLRAHHSSGSCTFGDTKTYTASLLDTSVKASGFVYT